MKDKDWCVYVHTNKTNHKKYVGISKNVELRWRANGYAYNRCPKFWSAIQHYGWDNFGHEVIENNLSFEEATKREQYYIKYFDSKNNGYNLTDGGEGGLGMRHSEETKKKMSEQRKGRTFTEEQRKRMGDAHRGKTTKKKGQKMSDEQKEKISKTWKEKYKDENYRKERLLNSHMNSIPVVCEGVKFNSIVECAKYYNIPRPTMTSWINGKFCLPEELVEKKLFIYGFEPEYIKLNNPVKKLYCDGIIFENINKCAEYYNVNVDTMRSWLNGKSKTMRKEFVDMDLHYIDTFKYKIDSKFYEMFKNK